MRITKAQQQAEAVKALLVSYSVFSRKIEQKEHDWRIWHGIAQEDQNKLNQLGIPVQIASL